MKCVLTGSLGHISRPLIELLVRDKVSVTVISSRSGRQKEIEALGAYAAIGSVEDVDFLAKTFANTDAIYCMTPPRQSLEPDPRLYGRRIGGNYAKAIKKADIRDVVHLSSWGAELDNGTGFILAAHEAERMLDELQNLSIVHIRPTSFYYNLFNFIPMIKNADFMASNYGGEDSMVFVDPADIAQTIAEELQTPGSGRKIRYVASDERSCNDTARILGQAIGIPGLTWRLLTDEQAYANLEAYGLPDHVAKNLVELGNASHRGVLREGYALHKPVLGKVKLEDFAATFLAEYNKKQDAPQH